MIGTDPPIHPQAMDTTALRQEQERDRRTGIVVSIVFHVLLTILFLFLGLKEPNPLPEEMGIELAMAEWGTTETGMGDSSSPDPGRQQAAAPPTAAATPEVPDEVATEEESPVETPKPEKPKPKPDPKPQPKPKPEPEKPKKTISDPLKDALSQWGKGGGDGGKGDGQQAGNQGVETGKPDGIGTFHGEGWSVSLGGRGLLNGPNITDRPEIQRRSVVVITIKVDRSGKVTNAVENLSKSNTTSQVLFNIGKKAARQATFSAKPDGPFEQQGEMTFIFDPQ